MDASRTTVGEDDCRPCLAKTWLIVKNRAGAFALRRAAALIFDALGKGASVTSQVCSIVEAPSAPNAAEVIDGRSDATTVVMVRTAKNGCLDMRAPTTGTRAW